MDAQSPSKYSSYWWLLLAIPVLIHFFLLYCYSVNAPRLDDFSEVLTFLPNFHEATQWQEKIRIFFSVYQDHRYGVTHAINLITDGINFRGYVLWGNLLLPTYVFLFWHTLKKHPLQREITIIATLLFFNLHTWYGTYWATILLTSLGSLPIALGTFLLACSSNYRLLPFAIISAIFLTYSLGNGILVWPLITAYVAVNNKRKSLPIWNRHSLSWLLAGILVLAAYFYDFHFFDKQGDGGAANISALITQALHNAPRAIWGFFCLAGGHLLYYSGHTDWRIILAGTAGLIETLALIYLLRRGVFRTRPALHLLLAFVFLTMLSIAIARVATINIGQALQGHYKLYTATYLLLLIIATLDWIQTHKPHLLRQSYLLCLSLASTLFITALFLFIPTVQQYHQTLADDTRQWLYSGVLQRDETRFFAKQPNKKLLRAIQDGFYNPWTLLSEQEIPRDIIYTQKCPAPLLRLPANIKSQLRALAVHIDAARPANIEKACLQGAQQAIYFSLPANSTHITLWVPRNNEIKEDAGPWALYALP